MFPHSIKSIIRIIIINEDNSGPKYIKGDELGGYLFV